MRLGKEGTATITCVVNDNGTVSNCTVTSESPAGNGFGAAAMTLSPKFKMKPQTKDGAPVGGAKVAVPIQFKIQ
ncbi:MAG: energy transducer TonB, partial [Alphaproteobacteria bacterium]